MQKNFVVIMVVTIAAMVGLFIVSGGKQSTDTTFEGDPLVVQEDENTFGNAEAKVTVLEYGDFECPACARSFPFVNQIKEEYKDDIQLVFRHFPLSQLNPNLHPNAFASHRAAQAAANQNKFWEMHDLLYETQNQWSRSVSGLNVSQATEFFAGLAEQIGLDMEQYNNDVNSEETSNFIRRQLASGSEIGVSGTPAFFINGEEVTSPQDQSTFEEFKAAIDSALEASDN